MVIMLPSDDEDLDQIGLHLIKQTFNYCRQEVGKFPEKTGVLLQPTIAIIANRTPKDKRSGKETIVKPKLYKAPINACHHPLALISGNGPCHLIVTHFDVINTASMQ